MLKHFTELFFNFFQQKPHVGKSGSPFDAEVFMLVINDNLYPPKYAKVSYPLKIQIFFKTEMLRITLSLKFFQISRRLIRASF